MVNRGRAPTIHEYQIYAGQTEALEKTARLTAVVVAIISLTTAGKYWLYIRIYKQPLLENLQFNCLPHGLRSLNAKIDGGWSPR